jgi:uncharacterized protein
MIPRAIGSQIKKMEGKYPVISVTGPRQSGKTTLVKELFPDYHYLNFENIATREFAITDPLGFLDAFGDRLIIDEAQHVPDLFSYIQITVDEHKHKRFVLTGSQNFLLLQSITQSLAGRVAIFYLLPLSYDELRGANLGSDDYLRFMVQGGYPAIYDRGAEPFEWLLNYITTYVERDVRQVLNVGSLVNFQRFVMLCAGRIGQLINLSAMANELGVSYHTIESWLSILETSFILYRLPPYYKSYNKRIIKSSKLYFNDTGLACALLGIDHPEKLTMHFLKGELFENMVFGELRKYMFNHSSRYPLHFWRDNSGREVDGIMEGTYDPTPFEIKSSMTINKNFFTNLHWWMKLSGSGRGCLIYGGGESYYREGIEILSWKDCHRIFHNPV